MTITTRTREQFQSDVSRWSDLLNSRQSLGYVQRVTIIGRIPLFPDDSYDGALADEEERCELEDEHQLDDPRRWDNRPDRLFFPPAQPFPSVWFYYTDASDNRDQQDDLWRPFVRLLNGLHGLADFIFASGEQLPRSILAALHHRHARVRLHMPYFDLKSLRYVKESPKQISDDDWALATSPCLYSVVARHAGYCEGNVDYNYEAVLEMMAHTAPNLKHVWLSEKGHGSSLEYQRAALSSPRPVWPGFPVSETNDQNGIPCTLVLDGLSHQIKNMFSGRSRIDFVFLTNLDILCQLPASILQDLLRIAKLGTFKALRSLGLPLSTPSSDNSQDAEDDAIGALLAAIDPLDSLTLYYHFREKPLEAILTYHGRSLRCLRLDTAENVSLLHLDRLQQHCLGVRDLQVSILRTQGDRHEVEIYRSLGKFPCLEKLDLRMRVHPANEAGFTGSSFDISEDTQGCLERLRHVFPNAAIDDALVCSIFQIICAAQGQKETLQYLRVQPRGISRVSNFGGRSDARTSCILTWIARSWICERGNWDDAIENVSTREVLASKRKYFDEDLAEMAKLAGRSDQVWREFWPDRTGEWMES